MIGFVPESRLRSSIFTERKLARNQTNLRAVGRD
jgi:hypothetical protein